MGVYFLLMNVTMSVNRAIQVLRNAMVLCGCVKFSDKALYEGVLFNDTSITRTWVGVKFPQKELRNT